MGRSCGNNLRLQKIFIKRGEKRLTKKTAHYIVVPTGTTHRKEAGKTCWKMEGFLIILRCCCILV